MSRWPLWTADKRFAGQEVVCIGGGPSLRGFDFSVLHGRRVIAVNNAWEIYPAAEILHFSDSRWWKWHGERLMASFQGDVTTCSLERRHVVHKRLKHLGKDYKGPLSKDPQKLFGTDSGTQAVNLAYLLGARRIVLLGYDMQFSEDGAAHWHKDHEIASIENRYKTIFALKLGNLVEALKEIGVEIVRGTEPGLKSIPYAPLEFMEKRT